MKQSPDSASERMLTAREVARMLHVSERTVSNWRYRGEGPDFVRISKTCVRYRLSDVRRWMAEREVR
ncbi:phage transcriptional regulator, AlpA [Bifidobacterium cuniculi]|uniref:Phage transcriptional regulator, AlpA n=2 Tax=Bifidobacterium cuniculi TaxID=1688 RepID=A0A087B3Z0_9BIFI|nr:phage transcriptional regulator, AlpA [Bifidobacterium cuniculi]